MKKTTNESQVARWRVLPRVAVFGLLALAACSDGGGGNGNGNGSGSGSSGGTAAVCSALGQKANACNAAVSEMTTAAACEDQFGALLSKLRADVASSIESCIQASDCTHAATAVGDCVDTAKASIAPSAAAKALCADLAKADMTCSATTFVDQASCLNGAKIFADAALQSADSCASQSCADIESCVAATLGDLGATTTNPPPPPPPPPPVCKPFLNTTTACGACMQQNCCAQVATCFGEASCSSCASGGACSNDPATTSLNSCIANACSGPCHG
jgi:hypothetical protein